MAVPYGVVISVPLAAVLLFFIMQPDNFALKQSIFVQAKPADVFAILRNPRILPKVAKEIKSVTIEKEDVDENGHVSMVLAIREQLPIIGNYTYVIHTVQDPNKHHIRGISKPLIWDLIQFNTSWSFTSIIKQGYAGTIITIDFSLNSPWAFIKLADVKIADIFQRVLKSSKKFGEVFSKQKA